MARPRNPDEDDLKELVFPLGGVELTKPSLMGRPDSTPEAETLRFIEALTTRGRGGSRPGIDPVIDGQVSGQNPIQHINTIVTIDGTLLDWSFDGPSQDFPGIYAGIGFTEFDLSMFPPFIFDFPTITPDGNPASETFQGASGYAPKDPKKKTILEISTSPVEVLWNQSSELTITLVDGDRHPFELPTKVVILSTDPPAQQGDGFTTDVVGGATMVTVAANEPMLVTYRAVAVSETGSVVAKSNIARVRFNRITPTINWAAPAPITSDTPLSATQLNATATAAGIGPVPGTFVYNPPAGTKLSVGTQTLSVSFTPTATKLFETPLDKTVSINVTTGGGGNVTIDEVSGASIANTTGSGPATTVLTTSFTISGAPHGPVTAIADPASTSYPSDVAIGSPIALFRLGGVWYYIYTPSL